VFKFVWWPGRVRAQSSGLWLKRRQSKQRQVQNRRKSVLSYADCMKSISALLEVQLLVSSDGLAR